VKFVGAAKNILKNGKVRAALAVGVTLFILSAVCDDLLYWSGVPAHATYLNDLVVGVTGGVCAGLVFSYQASRDAMERARERMSLTAELNHQLRSAVMTMANSVLLPDESDRLRAMDDAVQQIDEVLTGIGSTDGLGRWRN